MKNNLNYYSLLSLVLLAAFLMSLGSCDDKKDPVKENVNPVALFTVTPAAATVGDEITFTDQSGDEDGEISNWDWDFGDGESSSDQNPTHIYSQSGDYTITLIVTDDSEGTASYTATISINAFAELWKAQIGTASISPSAPAVGSDGTIYFGSQDFSVYAVNPSDGSIKWSYATGGKVRSTPAVGSDGTIYAPAQDNKLYALSSSGSLLWTFETTGSNFNNSPSIGSDGTIYYGTDDNSLYAINPDGSEKWSFETEAQIRTDPAIGSDGTIYIGSQDGKLYAISSAGAEVWSFEASAAIKASVCMDASGTIFFGDDAGKLFAVNSDGTQKWVFTTADNNPFLGGPVLGTDGSIYAATKRGPTTDTGLLYAISATGSEIWKYEMPKGDETEGSAQYYQNDILGTPTIGADGTIYVTFNDGNLYAFNDDGTVKFTYKVALDDPANRWDQAIWTSPALSEDGNLFFQDYSGYVYGLQVSASGLADSDWPTRGKNLRRTGL